jgi:hypothetical protein
MELLEDLEMEKARSYERFSGRQREMRRYLGACPQESLEHTDLNWLQRNWRSFWNARARGEDG